MKDSDLELLKQFGLVQRAAFFGLVVYVAGSGYWREYFSMVSVLFGFLGLMSIGLIRLIFEYNIGYTEVRSRRRMNDVSQKMWVYWGEEARRSVMMRIALNLVGMIMVISWILSTGW